MITAGQADHVPQPQRPPFLPDWDRYIAIDWDARFYPPKKEEAELDLRKCAELNPKLIRRML